MTDLNGVAAIIVALGVAVPSIVGAWVSVLNLRNGKVRDTKLAQVHDLVNGQSERLEALTFKADEVSGADKERAAPTTGNKPV